MQAGWRSLPVRPSSPALKGATQQLKKHNEQTKKNKNQKAECKACLSDQELATAAAGQPLEDAVQEERSSRDRGPVQRWVGAWGCCTPPPSSWFCFCHLRTATTSLRGAGHSLSMARQGHSRWQPLLSPHGAALRHRRCWQNHFLCSWLQLKLNAPPREQEAEADSERSTPDRTVFHRWHFSGLSNPSSSSANWSGSFSKTGKRQEGDGAKRTSNRDGSYRDKQP